MTKHKTISLVLGSGGARGLAHIGVIEQLVASGYEVKEIAGCSMGALIGGVYAMDRLDVYTRWVKTLERGDVIRLLDLSFGRNGLFKGDRIIDVLRSLIGDANIEDLPIRFTAVATDLEEEKEVWLQDGPLFDAIRASIAIPTIFTPYQYRGRQFVDGGLINPIPIGAIGEVDGGLTVAVNLSGRPGNTVKAHPAPPVDENHHRADRRQLIVQFVDDLKRRFERQSADTLGMLDIVIKSMGIMEHTLAQAQLKAHSPDIVIEIPKDFCTFYEFHKAQELIDLGRQRTEAALAAYEAEHA